MKAQYESFGEFLQKKRLENEITLRKMAELIGIPAPYLTDIEKDRRNPPEIQKLDKIAEILSLTEEEKEKFNESCDILREGYEGIL